MIAFPALGVHALGVAAAAGALVAAGWEGLVLAVVAGVCVSLVPGLSAARRWMVWSAVFVLAGVFQVVPLVERKTGSGVGTMHVAFGWALAVVAVWLGLSLLRAMQLGVGAWALRGAVRRAVEVRVDGLCAELLADRGVMLCVSTEVKRPSVVGFRRPRVLIPAGLLERLSEDDLRQVLFHELEHLRRGDDWTNLAQKVALVVFPLNPAMLWAERRLCRERELACDDRVVRETGSRKRYAECLARIAEHGMLGRGAALALGAWERRPELMRRVLRLLGKAEAPGSRWATGLVMAGVLGAGVMVARAPEVVSFGPVARPELAHRLAGPVFGAPAMGAPHTELVKAVIEPARPETAVGYRRAVARRRRRMPARTEVLKADVLESPEFITADPLAPRSVATGFEVGPAAGRMVTAIPDGRGSFVAVRTFAAVRVQGGWLVVEL